MSPIIRSVHILLMGKIELTACYKAQSIEEAKRYVKFGWFDCIALNVFPLPIPYICLHVFRQVVLILEEITCTHNIRHMHLSNQTGGKRYWVVS